jgi:hypothetical protein
MALAKKEMELEEKLAKRKCLIEQLLLIENEGRL